MFCPQCGTENNLEQKYCRHCGQPLSSVRLVLEGRVDQAVTTLQNEQTPLQHGIRMAVSVLLILTALATLFTRGRVGIVNLESGAVLMIIALLFFLQLAIRSRRVARLLNPAERLGRLTTDQSASSDALLPEATTVALPIPNAPVSMSVTEQTTLELKPEERGRRRPPE